MGRTFVHVHDGDTVHVFDAAEFQEAQHPRDPEGKFAKTPGGKAPPKDPPYVNFEVAKILKQAGYIKQKKSQKYEGILAEFTGPGGHTVLIHKPEPNTASAAKWSSLAPDPNTMNEKKGKGKELEALLKSLAARKASPAEAGLTPGTPAFAQAVEAVEAAKQPSPELIAHGKKLSAMGFITQLNADKSAIIGSGSYKTVVTMSPDGSWKAESPNHYAKLGQNIEQLNALLHDGKIAPGVYNGENISASVTPEMLLNQALGAPAPKAAPPAPKGAAPAPKGAAPAPNENVKQPLTSAQQNKLAAMAAHPEYGAAYAQIAAHTKPQTAAQTAAIDAYTDGSYAALNDCMRYDQPCAILIPKSRRSKNT